MTVALDRLRAGLADRYRIERDVGAGGGYGLPGTERGPTVTLAGP